MECAAKGAELPDQAFIPVEVRPGTEPRSLARVELILPNGLTVRLAEGLSAGLRNFNK